MRTKWRAIVACGEGLADYLNEEANEGRAVGDIFLLPADLYCPHSGGSCNEEHYRVLTYYLKP